MKKHLLYIIAFDLVLLLFGAACTQDNIPHDVIDEMNQTGKFVYNLHLNAETPGFDGHTTRSDNDWVDGSVVEIKFYTYIQFLNDTRRYWICSFITGTAVYHALSNSWELTTGEPLPIIEQGERNSSTFFSSGPLHVCEARYYDNKQSDQKGHLTAVYYGTSDYYHPTETDVYVAITLSPTTWRLRFKGEKGTSVNVCSKIYTDFGATLYENNLGMPTIIYDPEDQYLKLTVQPDGFTPYIYGYFNDDVEDHQITVITDGEYYRTINDKDLQKGESGVLTLPTKDNYQGKGWKRKIADANYFVGGPSGSWTNDKSQKFSHSSADVNDDPVFTYEFEGNGGTGDIFFAFGDEEAMEEMGRGNWRKLYGVKGESTNLSGSFGRRYYLDGDHPFCVDGKAKSYRFGVNMADMTYSITPLNNDGVPDRKMITVNNVSFNMVRVEGGTFSMGATAEQGSNAQDDEKPIHQVTLSTYFIGETEVTQELWQTVMGNNPSYHSGRMLPVEKVSWDDCQSFIARLNLLSGQNFRLPTEAEWEFAARGGNESKGYMFAGSNNWEEVAWYEGNTSLGNGTHDVGTKQANELGLYDMSGNVNEWCQDYYGVYGSDAQINPVGSSTGNFRVYRGGDWNNGLLKCRTSARDKGVPRNSSIVLGLRLVLPL